MLTRYQGGTKGPLIACHGLGTNSRMFKLTTVPKNFVEFFVCNEYDVWLLDSRQSTFCPWASKLAKYSLDDVANYDYPAAVDFVLKETNQVSFPRGSFHKGISHTWAVYQYNKFVIYQ